MPGPPPIPIQQPYQPVPTPPAPVAPKKKRSCLGSCCLFSFLFLVLLIGGLVGYSWYKYREPPSPVEQEYKTIPDYFPPEP